jgi:hypothetical protein
MPVGRLHPSYFTAEMDLARRAPTGLLFSVFFTFRLQCSRFAYKHLLRFKVCAISLFCYCPQFWHYQVWLRQAAAPLTPHRAGPSGPSLAANMPKSQRKRKRPKRARKRANPAALASPAIDQQGGARRCQHQRHVLLRLIGGSFSKLSRGTQDLTCTGSQLAQIVETSLVDQGN